MRERQAAIVERQTVVAVELDRLVEIGERAGRCRRARRRRGRGRCRPARSRVELDRLVLIGDGVVEVALVGVGVAAVVIDQRIGRD